MEQHHAYLYEGPLSVFEPLVADARARFANGALADSLSVYARVWDKFGIDESRELGSAASLRAVGGAQVFIVGVGSITAEAQQALLKLLEEPHAGVVFIFLVGHGALLPTLRSRFAAYPTALRAEESSRTDAAHFLSLPYKQRSDWIAAFLKDEEGVHERVRVFVQDLEEMLYTRLTMGTQPSASLYEALESVTAIRPYLSDRAPSLKMILEHFAATLPKL